MKYFRLYNSVEKQVGFVPQVHDAVVDFNIYDPASAYHVNFSKASENTLWPIAKLSPKAEKTDLISSSFMSLSNKLLISPKLYQIITNYETKGVQFIKSKLITKSGRKEDYWIVNPFLSDYSFLDPINCKFVYTDSMGKNELEEVKFNFPEEFIQAYIQNKRDAVVIGYPNHRPLIIKEIAFKDDSSPDFFAVSAVLNGYMGYFVSEKLRSAIEEAGCTGIVFTEPNKRYP